MLDKLAQIETRYEELTQELSSPELLSNPSAYGKAAKQHRSLGQIVEKYRELISINDQISGAFELQQSAEDEEMRELARVEIEALQARREQTENDLKLLLIPRDPNDEKNVILEIRAGTGGDEASLFAADILRMYARYAERQRWKMEILDASETGIGGLKEAVALIEGDTVYSRLKHESGASERRSMVGSGDRSEKIRTYNFKENRVTDHRIGLTIHQLNLVMDGALDQIIDGLTTHYQAAKLQEEAVLV